MPFYKNISKLIFTFWLFSQFFIAALAQTPTVDLQINKTELDINESLVLTLKITANKNISIGEIAIEGIQDNFEKTGQSTTSSFQNINGEVNVIYNLKLNLQAKEAGEYTLWPAFFNHNQQKISSKKITVKITGNKMFLNNVSSQLMNQLNQPSESETKETNTETISIEKEDTTQTDNSELNLEQRRNNYWQLFWLIAALIITFSLLYLSITKQKKKAVLEINKIKTKKENKKQSNFNQEIKLPTIDDANFLIKLDQTVRLILQSKLQQDLEQKTHQEMLCIAQKELTNSDQLEQIETILHIMSRIIYDQDTETNENTMEILKQVQILKESLQNL